MHTETTANHYADEDAVRGTYERLMAGRNRGVARPSRERYVATEKIKGPQAATKLVAMDPLSRLCVAGHREHPGGCFRGDTWHLAHCKGIQSNCSCSPVYL
jgi:hypothetical protein